MTIRPGDPLPELTLSAADGRAFGLASLRGETTLIVFLRHLG